MAAQMPFFVIPRRGVNTLCAVHEGRILEGYPVPMPLLAPHSISANGWLAWIEEDGATLCYTFHDADGAICPPDRLLQPAGFKLCTLLFHGAVLFVGGTGVPFGAQMQDVGSEILGMVNFSTTPPKWSAIAVPAEVLRRGKSIDALLMDDDRLIAVDDVVPPKWLLVYDVRDPVRPKLTKQSSIHAHGTYERIWGAAMGTRWIALISGTMGDCGSDEHIALYRRDGLTERGGCFSTDRALHGQTLDGSRDASSLRWNDVAWSDDLLHIAAGAGGLGVIDQGPGSVQHEIVYHPMPGAVIRLYPVPGTRQILVVVENETGYDTLVWDGALGRTLDRRDPPPGMDGQDSLGALVERLTDESRFVRLETVRILGQAGGRARTAVPALLRILSAANETRPIWFQPYHMFGQRRCDEGAAEMQHIPWAADDTHLIWSTFEALEHIAPESLTGAEALSAVPGLIHLLYCSHRGVGRRALTTLIGLGQARAAAPALAAAVLCWPRDSRRQALEELTTASGMNLAVLITAALKEMSPPPQFLWQLEAIGALIGPKDETALPALIAALKDDAMPRWWAMVALGSIGPAARAAVPTLLQLQDQLTNTVYHRFVATALKKIQGE